MKLKALIAAPNFWAWCLAILIFPLIWTGGLVTTNDAGMAVPDWPGTYGYNLFLYPISTWIYGPFDLMVEHGHRLLGATCGFLAIGLVLAAYLGAASKRLKVWSAVMLLSIISQGLLGGARVVMDERTYALIHGCTGPMVFVLASYLVILTNRESIAKPPNRIESNTTTLAGFGRWARFCIWFLAVSSLLQLIIGASLRHVDTSLAPAKFMGLAHLHLTMATILVLGILIAFGVSLASRRWRAAGAYRLATLLFGLILLQVALGFSTWFVNYALPWSADNAVLAAHVNELKGFWESMIVTGHQAVGSLILVSCFVFAIRVGSWRLPAASSSVA